MNGGASRKDKNKKGSVPAKALIRERSKSLELEFPPSYSYSSTISCCSVGSQPPRTTEMSVVILSIRPTTHFYLTLRKGAPETETIELLSQLLKCNGIEFHVRVFPFFLFFFFFSATESWIVIFKKFSIERRVIFLILPFIYPLLFYYVHEIFSQIVIIFIPPPFSVINKLLFLKLYDRLYFSHFNSKNLT